MKAEIFNLRVWIQGADERYIKTNLDKILKESELTVLGDMEKQFSPYGYTKLWLLAESHLAIHTFPEENKTYIELSSCHSGKQNTFTNLLYETFTMTKEQK